MALDEGKKENKRNMKDEKKNILKESVVNVAQSYLSNSNIH